MSTTLESQHTVIEIDPVLINPSPMNPRKHFDPDELKKLADSMKANGQIQEIVVYKAEQMHNEGYEIIAGERRWRAAKIAKLKFLRCNVIDVTEEEAIELRGLENFQRQDFNAIEEATWFRQMLENCDYTQAALAKKLGVTQSHISNRVRLLQLPEFFQDKIISGEIPPSLARLMVPLVKHEQVSQALQEKYRKDFLEELFDFDIYLRESVESVGRPLESIQFNRNAKVDKELDVLTINESDGFKSEYAMNVEYFDQLQSEAKKEEKKKQEKPKKNIDQPKEKFSVNDWQYRNKIELYKSDWIKSQIQQLGKIPDAYVLPFAIVFDSPYLISNDKNILSAKGAELKKLAQKAILASIDEAYSLPMLTEAASLLGIKIEDWKYDKEILTRLTKCYLEVIAREWKLISKKADKEEFLKLGEVERRNWINERSEGLTAPKSLLKA